MGDEERAVTDEERLMATATRVRERRGLKSLHVNLVVPIVGNGEAVGEPVIEANILTSGSGGSANATRLFKDEVCSGFTPALLALAEAMGKELVSTVDRWVGPVKISPS